MMARDGKDEYTEGKITEMEVETNERKRKDK